MATPGNPYTFWLEARSNCEVMKLAFGPKGIVPKHGMVGYNLAAHALELVLKGFLLASGYDQLRLKKIGHDLGDGFFRGAFAAQRLRDAAHAVFGGQTAGRTFHVTGFIEKAQRHTPVGGALHFHFLETCRNQLRDKLRA